MQDVEQEFNRGTVVRGCAIRADRGIVEGEEGMVKLYMEMVHVFGLGLMVLVSSFSDTAVIGTPL